jgi:hypothetical protein
MATSIQGQATEEIQTKLDGVYFDSALGAAGTKWPIGTPESPSNTITNALTIMAAWGVHKLYLVGGSVAAPVAISFTTAVELELVGGQGYSITFNHAGLTSDIQGDFNGNSLTVTTGSVTIAGDCKMLGALENDGAGTITIGGDFYSSNFGFVTNGIFNLGGGTIIITGDAYTDGGIGGGGQITIGGNVVSPDAKLGTSGVATIGGNCLCLRIISAGQLTINGDCHIIGDLGGFNGFDNSGTTIINGNCYIEIIGINNSGTLTINGLLGCSNNSITNSGTLTYLGKVEAAQLTEEHFHNVEHSFGLAAAPSGTHGGDINRLTPYNPASGAGVFGAAILLLGSGDTPVLPGSTTFDISHINVIAASSATEYNIRIIFGTSTAANAVAANQYTEVNYIRPSAAVNGSPDDIMMPDVPSGTSVWVEIQNATNGATLTLYILEHEHPAPFQIGALA